MNALRSLAGNPVTSLAGAAVIGLNVAAALGYITWENAEKASLAVVGAGFLGAKDAKKDGESK